MTCVPQGHAAPVLYAVWAETGYLKENELLNLRKVDSILEGHPVPVRRLYTLHLIKLFNRLMIDESVIIEQEKQGFIFITVCS